VEQASVQSHTPVQEKKHKKIKIAITSKILIIQKRKQIRRWKEAKIINFKKINEIVLRGWKIMGKNRSYPKGERSSLL
jgi:hypothetical protein